MRWDFAIFDFEKHQNFEVDKTGFKYVLRELTKAPWSYKILSIVGRNEWSLRVHVQQGDQDFMLVVIDPHLHTIPQVSFLQKRELRLSTIVSSEDAAIPLEYVHKERLSFIKYPYQ